MSEITIQMTGALAETGRKDWDAVANPEGAAYDPFLSWDFLDAIERSGSAMPETGWGPRHLIAKDGEGRVAGVLPLYLKGHSYGEYVFDHAWANALERGGGRYYPKLLTAAPFTPATGRRVLSPEPSVRRALIAGARHAAREMDLSSWHVLFPDAGQAKELAGADLMIRHDVQFVFENPGYRDYADFLDALSSRKRKALRKERAAAQAGLEIEALTGAAITEAHWDVFFECYQDTGARKWGTPYLTRDFFSLAGERMADQILLVMAKREGRYIASALNFIGSEALFGRYWGCLEDQDSLHFELCYHQAIAYALARGLKRVEAGAQGAHKLARGYRPVIVRSAHDIVHPGLRAAVADY
ncbi:MAG: GNAT family N-acetyltransferase, partial [Oceanicaulis sp.]